MAQTSIEQILSAQGTRLLRQQIISNGTGGLVFRLKTSKGERILKMQSKSEFSNMLNAEKIGLQTLKENGRFKIPEVFAQGKIDEIDYLLMEFIPNGKPVAHFWEVFAENLADLHRNSASYFGFSERNYIGSLPQFNLKENTAAEFYINQRLKPQFKLASENGFSFKNLESVYKNISAEIPDEKPALIHGDLWSGNYLIDEKGFPALIDPAVCFGPREMDLAMMQLFGGFPETVFATYKAVFPVEKDFEKRVPLWQLYYLLVHLNLFGNSYFSQVYRILKGYR